MDDVARAVEEAVPQASTRLRERLRFTSDFEADAKLLAQLLAEESSRWPRSAWVVLDDYENIARSSAFDVFCCEVANASRMNLLIASRSGPSWVIARDLLYGDVLEIERPALAFTPAETSSVLGPLADESLIEQVAGWPTIASLALIIPDLASARLGRELLPDALGAYIVDELYQSLDYVTRVALWKLAIADVSDPKLAKELIGETYFRLITSRAEWFVSSDGMGLELHPLLRAFLRSVTPPLGEEELKSTVSDVALRLLHRRRWDHAFEIAERFELLDVANELLRCINTTPSSGRSASLKRWISFGASMGCDPGLLNLSAADIAFKEGRFYESEALAVAAAAAFDATDPLRVQAWMLAGRSAHTGSREREALLYYRRAGRHAKRPDDQWTAALGEVAAATDLELPRAFAILDELEASLPPGRTDLVVAVTNRRIAAASRFGLPPDFERARSGYQLIAQLDDPIARTSYRNAFAYLLSVAGQLDEARVVVLDQRREAQRYRLAFVDSYTHIVDALIALIAGKLDEAGETIKRLNEVARAQTDGFLRSNVVAIGTRLLVSQGRFAEAVESSFEDPGATTLSMKGEIRGSRAIALACAGRNADALAEVNATIEQTQSVDARVMAAAARAVVAVRCASGDALELARIALADATRLCSLDGFIAGYRGYPELAALLMSDDVSRNDLRFVLRIAGDVERVQRLLPPPESKERTWEALSTREKEVLGLVAEGLSNKQIAARLFIAEVTVKVHVSHILEKLGVTSRTAAARHAPPLASPMPPLRREHDG